LPQYSFCLISSHCLAFLLDATSLGLKLSRQDPNFRKKENQKQVDFKRKARGDQEIRQKEILNKRISRLNITIRNKERQREIGSVNVNLLTSIVEECGFEPRSSKIKNYKIGF
jgi:hypothetical protein